MTVRAKLYVASTERQAGAPDAVKIVLAAVTRGEENRSWAEASPSGRFELTIQNPDAAVQFTLGQEFYVDFTPTGTPATLADGHEYEPGDYEAKEIDRLRGTTIRASNHHRCAVCGCKRSSHEPEARAKLADWRP